jgi:peptidoglycan hydrolase CwlO-like protein
MPHIATRTLRPLLVAAIMVSVGYVAAQQNPNPQPARTVTPQSPETASAQQNDQLRDQIVQLQMQVKDLQAKTEDLNSKQQLVSENLDSLSRAADRQQKQIDKLGQQVSSATLQLQRVKTKIGLY